MKVGTSYSRTPAWFARAKASSNLYTNNKRDLTDLFDQRTTDLRTRSDFSKHYGSGFGVIFIRFTIIHPCYDVMFDNIFSLSLSIYASSNTQVIAISFHVVIVNLYSRI